LQKKLVPNLFVEQMDTAYVLDYNGLIVWEYRFLKDGKRTVFLLGFDIDSSKIRIPHISIGDKRDEVQRLVSPNLVCDSTDIYFYPDPFAPYQLKVNYGRENRINRISVTYPLD
jgi:hypothetical protein